MHFQIELRFGVRQFFPGFADLPRLLFALPMAGSSDHDSRRLQTVPGAQNTVPQVVGRNHRQANRFAAFFRHGKRLRKKMLFDAAKKLVRVEFLFAGSRTAQDAHVQADHSAASVLHSIQHISQVIQVEVIADRHQDVASLGANRFRRQFAFQLQIELVHLHVRDAGMTRAFFRDCENDIQQNGERAAGHGGHRLGEQVDEGDQEKHQSDESQTEWNLLSTNREIQRYLKFALAGIGVTQYQDREAVHGKTPDHAEGIEVCEKGDITAADQNRNHLQDDDDVDEAVASAEARMRLAKPIAEHAVFGNPIQHTVGADNCGVHRAGQNHRADHHHECVKNQPNRQWPGKIHGQAADEIFQKSLAYAVWNDHHREERDQRSENHAVNENDHARFFEIDQLGALNFAVHLRQRFFSAHRQH